METGLEGKRVLVTGAAGGIGAELIRAFHAEKAEVIGHYFRTEMSAELKSLCRPVRADLTREDDVLALFEKAGPVDVCIANAGIWVEKPTPIHQMSLEQWNHTLSTNLTSMFLCLREFVRGIERHKLTEPAAVLVGSTAGVYGEAGHCDYAASKSGATYGMMLSLKNEIARLAPRGRINAVCPSWVLTPMVGDFRSKTEEVTRVLQTVALRKIGRVNDIAAAVTFLSSSKLAGHLSGQSMVLAGGMEGRVLYAPEEIDLSRA